MSDSTTELLQKHFDLAVEAPDGIAKLRELILTLAMQGKLVPQDPNDPPASELLKEIEAEKRLLAKLGTTKRPKVFDPVLESETFFDIPSTWAWTRLGVALTKITDGTHHSPPNVESGDFLYISAKNIKEEGVLLSNATFVTREIHEEIYSRCNPEFGDLLYIKDGATTGIATINNLTEPFSMLSSVALLKPSSGVFNVFLLHALRSQFFYTEVRAEMTGVAITRVTLQKLENAIIPLPPLPEQRRIVAKIDQLMAVRDDLEKKRDALVQKRLAVHNAAIRRLLEAGEASEFALAWDFLVEHFREVYSVKENVAELRKAILQLAVMGKLVQQDPNEESAHTLLSRMAIERRNLLAGGYPNPDESRSQMRKQASQILPEALPPLPSNWAWATLLQCSLLIVDCHNKTAPYVTSGIRLLRTTNIRNGTVNFDEPKFVSEETYTRWSARCEPEPGDILITREAPMGEVCIIPPGLKICLGQRLMLARTVLGFIENRYLLLTLRAPDMMERVQDKPVGATVQHLRVGGVETMLVPLPPLSEQLRIVAKVDQLMALCDRLETQIYTATAQTTAILKGVLATA